MAASDERGSEKDATGAWVVYDLYWDPVTSFGSSEEAQAFASAHGCHVIFDPKGTPGRLRDDNFGHWDGFMEMYPDSSETDGAG